MRELIIITSAFTGLAAFAAAVRRYIVRPARRLILVVIEIAGQLRTASKSAQDLAALSGAITQVVVAFAGRLDNADVRLAEHESRLDDLAELVVDNTADIRRLQKAGRP